MVGTEWRYFWGSQPPFEVGAKEPEHVFGRNAATPGDPVFAVGRKGEISPAAKRAPGANLRGLLSLHGSPQCELSLAL